MITAVLILSVGGSANNILSIVICHHFHENDYLEKLLEIHISLILNVIIGLLVHEVEGHSVQTI
jgi:uncharacterized membrane protein